MLQFKMTNADVLEVTESLMSFTETKRSYWYYDVKNWLKSSFGKKNDIPDRKMSDSDIEWVKKYYLPKVV